MGYQISYDTRTDRYEIRSDNGVISVFLAVVGAAFALALCVSQEFRAWVIPGEDALTIRAFSAMTDDLRSGAGVGEAMEAFCRMVIHGK